MDPTKTQPSAEFNGASKVYRYSIYIYIQLYNIIYIVFFLKHKLPETWGTSSSQTVCQLDATIWFWKHNYGPWPIYK